MFCSITSIKIKYMMYNIESNRIKSIEWISKLQFKELKKLYLSICDMNIDNNLIEKIEPLIYL
jgi:hypothetical protein